MACLVLAAAPAAAQQVAPAPLSSPYQRALAAGYKAAMLCSAMFGGGAAGGRTQASVEANELKGIYPEYDAIVAGLAATIDREQDRILVHYDDRMPPRIAKLRTGGGCTNLPIGTKPEAVQRDLRIGSEPFGKRADRTTIAPTLGKLRGVVRAAFDATAYGAGSNTTAVVISRDGKIIAERYAEGFGVRTPQRTWSVAKSMAGTLIGMSVRLGLVDPKAPAPIPEWQTPGDPRQAITLDNLLRMTSGLYSNTAGNRTDAVYFGGVSVLEETVSWPLEVPPGTRFRYANNDILLAVRALRSKFVDVGGVSSFPPDLMLAQIGLEDTVAEVDWRGNYMLSSQVWSTARDLARLGQFWLKDGVWQGERLLPEGWMRYMTTPSGPQPASGPGYGATLWLFGPTQGLPEGSYAAQGNRGQYVMVIPSQRLVIVRRGEDPGSARFDIAKFAADVAAAL